MNNRIGLIIAISFVCCASAQIVSAQPTVPTAPSPKPGDTLPADIPPTLTWQSNGTSYVVEYGKGTAAACTASNKEPAVTASTLTLPKALAAGYYCWDVVAADAGGTTVKGPTWNFTVASADQPASSLDDQLKNLGFGVALSFRWNFLKPYIVNDAVIDSDGIVRVNSRNNTNAGFMLEMHYFAKRSKNDTVGFGPFVAVQPGSDQIITAIGAGVMVGWRLSSTGKGFGLGIGYASQPSAKTLGNEFVEDQPAPLGPDGKPLPLRFEQRDKGSLLAVCSFVF